MAGAAGSTEQQRTDVSAVTVLCKGRRLDLALPSAVPCAELLPVLLRLLVPAQPVRAGVEQIDVPAAPELITWQLTTIAGPPISAADTLASSGVLDGDLLELRAVGSDAPTMVNGTVRDRIEDVVTDRARSWTDRTSRMFVHTAVVMVSAGLLVPVTQLPLGMSLAGLAGVFAAAVSVMAAAMVHRSAIDGSTQTGAAIMLLVGCSWAWLAGTTAILSQVAVGPAMSGRSTIAVLAELLSRPATVPGWPAIPTFAVGGLVALGLAACLMAYQPAAVVHVAALVVVVGALLILTAAVAVGVPATNAGIVLAVCAVLAIGGLPRAALLAGGLSNNELAGDPAALAMRFDRSDRVLTGSVIGVSLVAAAVALPAAFMADRWWQLFAGGIGLVLLLRSRSFSQVPHAVGPRIAGTVVFGALWVHAYRGAAAGVPGLLLVLAVGAVAAAMAVAGRRPADSPVGWARVSRLLGVTEQLTVVLLVVLAAGICGLFDWMSQILG